MGVKCAFLHWGSNVSYKYLKKKVMRKIVVATKCEIYTLYLVKYIVKSNDAYNKQPYGINSLVLLMEAACVLCGLANESLYVI
jgi:hypothetical protein